MVGTKPSGSLYFQIPHSFWASGHVGKHTLWEASLFSVVSGLVCMGSHQTPEAHDTLGLRLPGMCTQRKFSYLSSKWNHFHKRETCWHSQFSKDTGDQNCITAISILSHPRGVPAKREACWNTVLYMIFSLLHLPSQEPHWLLPSGPFISYKMYLAERY